MPEFTSRPRITNLFSEFTEKFTNNAREHGVELHWIGVGTWKTPISNVFEKHLEAWKLSRENEALGNDDAMQGYEAEIGLMKLLIFIREIPILAYRKILGTSKPGIYSAKPEIKNEQNDSVLDKESVELLEKFFGRDRKQTDNLSTKSHQDAMQALLLEYRKLLIEARDFIREKNQIVPKILEDAITHINDVLGYKHWAGVS